MKQLVCAKDVETLKEEGRQSTVSVRARSSHLPQGMQLTPLELHFHIKRKAVGEMPHQ